MIGAFPVSTSEINEHKNEDIDIFVDQDSDCQILLEDDVLLTSKIEDRGHTMRFRLNSLKRSLQTLEPVTVPCFFIRSDGSVLWNCSSTVVFYCDDIPEAKNLYSETRDYSLRTM